MRAVIRAVNQLNDSMLYIAGAMIVIMSLSMFLDIAMRYLFTQPMEWSFDLVRWLSGYSAMLAGAYALLHNTHVRIDMYYERFSLRTKSIVNAITSIFLLAMVYLFITKGIAQIVHFYKLDAVEQTGLNIHVWIKWTMIPIGGILLGLQALAHLYCDIYAAITGESYMKEETQHD